MRIKTSQLVIILLLALICSVSFYVIQLFYTSSINNRSSLIYEQSLVASINQYEYLPSLIAEDDALRQVILEPNTHYLAASEKLKFIAKRSGAEVVYLMDKSGTVKATSNHDERNGGFLYHNYSFRPYFNRAIAESSRQFYYAKGATTGIPGFFISSPIFYNNEAIGVAVVKLDLSHWEEKWSNSAENIAVADENNIIILSSIEPWRYRSIGEPSKGVLEKINHQQQFIGSQHNNLYSKSVNFSFSQDNHKTFWIVDKKLYLVSSLNVSETGWKLYYLVNHSSILNDALIIFFIISILLFLAQLNINNKKHITESKNKNRALQKRRQEELQTIMDNIHIGVILFSKSGELISTNEHAKHLLLIKNNINSKENTLHIHQLIDITDEGFDNILLQDIAAPAYHETTTNTKNPIPVMFAISKVDTMENQAYLMTIVNISRRKMAENQLIEINSELENIIENRTKELQSTQNKLNQKNKATALGNMAATIVHELSQPLTAMKSSIAAIDAKIKKSDWKGASESATRLAPLNEKMHSVIKLLKFFSYQDNDSHINIDVTETINRTLDTFKDVFKEKNISFTLNNAYDEILISANPLKIDLILSNIIQNAIDVLEKAQDPLLTITTSCSKGSVFLSIEDNAGGIDNNVKEKMFNPYFTTKEVGKGLGLGLAITYEIVQEYGGSIEVENILKNTYTGNKNVQQGAQFIISFPLVDHKESTQDHHIATHL